MKHDFEFDDDVGASVCKRCGYIFGNVAEYRKCGNIKKPKEEKFHEEDFEKTLDKDMGVFT